MSRISRHREIHFWRRGGWRFKKIISFRLCENGSKRNIWAKFWHGVRNIPTGATIGQRFLEDYSKRGVGKFLFFWILKLKAKMPFEILITRIHQLFREIQQKEVFRCLDQPQLTVWNLMLNNFYKKHFNMIHVSVMIYPFFLWPTLLFSCVLRAVSPRVHHNVSASM